MSATRKRDERAAQWAMYPGAYAWILTDVRKVKPSPVRGQLGIFNVEIVPRDLAIEA
jgi:hypothetical protein